MPKNFIPSVEKGLRNCVGKGVLAGYPVVFLKATLYFGSSHPVDSSDMAFQTAAGIAYKDGLPNAGPTLLEPICELKEDLISTGGSVLEVVNVLREAGAQVLGVVSIFTYGMAKGLKRLAEAQVKHVSLTNFDVIAQVAAEEHYIRPQDVARLISFRDNPSDESWIGGTK